MPLNTILLCSTISRLIRLCTAMSKSSAASSSSAASRNASARMVFNTTLGEDTESEEPTMRNSNLLPVNAKGEVLFLSVASLAKSGMVRTPV